MATWVWVVIAIAVVVVVALVAGAVTKSNTYSSANQKNAFDLLVSFISFGRSSPDTNKLLTKDIWSTPPITPFTLTTGDKTVAKVMASNEASTAWIERKIINPCKSIGINVLNEEQITKFINIAAPALVSKELQTEFIKRAQVKQKNLIAANNATVHTVSNDLLQTGLSLNGKSHLHTPKAEMSSTLTSIFLESILTDADSKRIARHIARIADTNWEDDSKHIYFCCFWDPVTASVQLGTIDDDGTQLQCINQDEWVKNVPWEMFGVAL